MYTTDILGHLSMCGMSKCLVRWYTLTLAFGCTRRHFYVLLRSIRGRRGLLPRVGEITTLSRVSPEVTGVTSVIVRVYGSIGHPYKRSNESSLSQRGDFVGRSLGELNLDAKRCSSRLGVSNSRMSCSASFLCQFVGRQPSAANSNGRSVVPRMNVFTATPDAYELACSLNYTQPYSC